MNGCFPSPAGPLFWPQDGQLAEKWVTTEGPLRAESGPLHCCPGQGTGRDAAAIWDGELALPAQNGHSTQSQGSPSGGPEALSATSDGEILSQQMGHPALAKTPIRTGADITPSLDALDDCRWLGVGIWGLLQL